MAGLFPPSTEHDRASKIRTWGCGSSVAPRSNRNKTDAFRHDHTFPAITGSGVVRIHAAFAKGHARGDLNSERGLILIYSCSRTMGRRASNSFHVERIQT